MEAKPVHAAAEGRAAVKGAAAAVVLGDGEDTQAMRKTTTIMMVVDGELGVNWTERGELDGGSGVQW